jgi:hypothetical protein
VFDADSPVRTIIAGADTPLADTFANRLVPASTAGRSVRHLLLDVSAEVAASHLVDQAARSLLAADDTTGFLARRSKLLSRTVRGHVNTMAEWGARDGRSLASIVRSVA